MCSDSDPLPVGRLLNALGPVLGWRGRLGVLAGSILLMIALTADATADSAANAATQELRVCADPNNLPFSNRRRLGLENVLAEMIARDLHRTVRYTWWPQRRGFLRNTLDAGVCDVIMGVPAGYDPVLTTVPYYRSTYVFVSRRDRQLGIQSLDDPRLKSLRIGVHVNVPPTQILAARHLQNNIRGYSLTGNYLQRNPPRALIDAVAHGEVDLAIAWGPLAGYFAAREPVSLELTPVPMAADLPFLPMSYAISMGVRKDDPALQALLNGEIKRRQAAIGRLMTRYGVPLAANQASHSGPRGGP